MLLKNHFESRWCLLECHLKFILWWCCCCAAEGNGVLPSPSIQPDSNTHIWTSGRCFLLCWKQLLHLGVWWLQGCTRSPSLMSWPFLHQSTLTIMWLRQCLSSAASQIMALGRISVQHEQLNSCSSGSSSPAYRNVCAVGSSSWPMLVWQTPPQRAWAWGWLWGWHPAASRGEYHPAVSCRKLLWRKGRTPATTVWLQTVTQTTSSCCFYRFKQHLLPLRGVRAIAALSVSS